MSIFHNSCSITSRGKHATADADFDEWSHCSRPQSHMSCLPDALRGIIYIQNIRTHVYNVVRQLALGIGLGYNRV